jgi:hypothetical protein
MLKKIRENNTLLYYLSNLKIRKRLLKIQSIEQIAIVTEYSRELVEY